MVGITFNPPSLKKSWLGPKIRILRKENKEPLKKPLNLGTLGKSTFLKPDVHYKLLKSL